VNKIYIKIKNRPFQKASTLPPWRKLQLTTPLNCYQKWFTISLLADENFLCGERVWMFFAMM
jgi:hypothetical protein